LQQKILLQQLNRTIFIKSFLSGLHLKKKKIKKKQGPRAIPRPTWKARNQQHRGIETNLSTTRQN